MSDDFEKAIVRESKIYDTPKERGAFIDGGEWARDWCEDNMITQAKHHNATSEVAKLRAKNERLKAHAEKMAEALENLKNVFPQVNASPRTCDAKTAAHIALNEFRKSEAE